MADPTTNATHTTDTTPALHTDVIDSHIENFKYATGLIKIIFIIIGIVIFLFSRYAFIFFSAAMLPSIAIIFADKAHHKCASATVCTFNLMGAVPYLRELWQAQDINNVAKTIISEPIAWLVIFSTAFVGFMIYIAVPSIIAQIYVAKANIRITALMEQRNKVCSEWDIKIEEQPSKDDPLFSSTL